MKNLDQDPAVLVSEERAKLFAPIQDRLELLISESNTPPKIEFENKMAKSSTKHLFQYPSGDDRNLI